MLGLFRFLYRFRTFLLFVLLELLCGWLVVQNNYYQSAAYFHTSNRYAARFLAFSNSINEYLNLRNENRKLAQENAELRKIYQKKLLQTEHQPFVRPDSSRQDSMEFLPAKVVNNSTGSTKNYLTLSIGKQEGVEPGMGVMTGNGIVGRIKTCSEHFSTVTSLLHTDMQVSVQLKTRQTVGSVQWEGSNTRRINLKFIPRDVPVQEGDTVVTSQYNSVFPQGIPVGTIETTRLKADETFHEIKVKLATDFHSLGYVYVVRYLLRNEQEKLEKQLPVK
jgi:rod shape-determining protein MreC